MPDRDWESNYEQILHSSLDREEIDTREKSRENRVAPRFSLKSGTIWIKVDQSFHVNDISVSGISFYSTRPFEIKKKIAITLGKVFLIEAAVVDCRIVETDPDMLEAHYRISCQFSNEHSATQFLVILKDMDEIGVEVWEAEQDSG